jgi:GR25 family glycosyltransferase involved in LPS biosynthesis
MNYIDKVYYINLDHRKDRLEQIEQVMNDLDIPLDKRERISAIYDDKFGMVGCYKSHILTLEKFIESNYTSCIVFEDDFIFYQKEQFHGILNSIFENKVDFDIIQLAYNDRYESLHSTNYHFLKTVAKAGTTSALLIHRQFAQQLLENFKEGLRLLTEHIEIHNSIVHGYCLDVYWNKLPKSKWYVTYPKIGLQRASYSDIEKRYTDYGV